MASRARSKSAALAIIPFVERRDSFNTDPPIRLISGHINRNKSCNPARVPHYVYIARFHELPPEGQTSDPVLANVTAGPPARISAALTR
jgi:hypothetical protein